MRLRSSLLLGQSLALISVALLGGGCGGSARDNGVAAKPPEQIVAAAKAAAGSAASVHVSGSVVTEGKPLTIDLELLAGKGGRGRITLEGLSIDLVRVGGAVYISGSEAFYRRVAGPAAAQLLKGKWLKAPESSGNFASFASLTDLGKLIDTTLTSHGSLVTAGTSTVNGQKAVGVRDVSKSGILYVATTGKPYPLEIAKASGGGTITFDRWDQPVALSAPTNAININQLQSGH